jgi:hypothetical protein
MKNMIRLEELAMFLLSIYLFNQLHFAWWWYPALILTPDLSMIGYAGNNTSGAVCYNLFHHKGLAIAVYFIGCYLQSELFQLAGLILFGHSSMDRMLGYGLKYFKGFKFTHLGEIGK